MWVNCLFGLVYRLLGPAFRSVPEFSRLRAHRKEEVELGGEEGVWQREEEERKVPPSEVLLESVGEEEVEGKEEDGGGEMDGLPMVPRLKPSQPHRRHHSVAVRPPPLPTAHTLPEHNNTETHIRSVPYILVYSTSRRGSSHIASLCIPCYILHHHVPIQKITHAMDS